MPSCRAALSLAWHSCLSPSEDYPVNGPCSGVILRPGDAEVICGLCVATCLRRAAWRADDPQGLNRAFLPQKCVALNWASQVALVVKNPPANSGDIRDAGLIPESRRLPGGGHGNPLRCSSLVNPKDRGAWWAAAYRVAESDRTAHKHMKLNCQIGDGLK